MPTIITHSLSGLLFGKIFGTGKPSLRFWILSFILPVLPDLDVISFRLGIPYEHVLGHRGLSHSLLFAAVPGIFAAVILYSGRPKCNLRWWGLAGYFTLITASHGLFDAMTRGGGLGIAFFAPFDNTRYFLPWRVIRVSPIRLSSFLSEKGVAVMISEFLWIWIPLTLLAVAVTGLRYYFRRRARQ